MEWYAPAREPWGIRVGWLAVPIVAVLEFIFLGVLVETPTWGAALGALAIAALSVPAVWLWRSRSRRWAWAGIGLALVLGLPLSILRGLESCRLCGTFRRHVDLGWGITEAWVRLPLGRSAPPTHALADFYGGDHPHDWAFAYEYMDGAFGLNTLVSGGYRSCGGDYPNFFANRYERDESFRALVGGKVASGEVTANQVRLLLGLPRGFRRLPSVPPGTHALVKAAGAWMGEYLWHPGLEEEWPPERPVAK